MVIESLKLSGSLNTLKFAINNGIDLRGNPEMVQIINNECMVNIKLTGLNFYQAFQLLIVHRDKMRLIGGANPYQQSDEMSGVSPQYIGDIYGNDKTDDIISYLNQCESVAVQYMTAKRNADDIGVIADRFNIDMITPMINVLFDAYIQYPFDVLFNTINEDNSYDDIFKGDISSNLNRVYKSGKLHYTLNKMMIDIDRQMAPYIYDNKTEKVLNITKYFTLKDANDIATVKILSFFKYNPADSSVVNVSMFNSTKDELRAGMKELKMIRTPMEVSFSVQMPMYYLLRLMQIYPEDVMKVSYLSSINNIMNNDIGYITNMLQGDDVLSEFIVRINECHLDGLKLYRDLTTTDGNAVFKGDAFTLMPTMLLCNAVITLNENILNHNLPSNEIIADVLTEMKDVVEELTRNINSI